MTSDTQYGLSFDASELFRPLSAEPVPPGEIVIRPAFRVIEVPRDIIAIDVPEGISPRSLRDSIVGKQLIWQDITWYDKEPWANESLPPGLYHLRLPVADSNRRTFDEQKALLRDGEEVAPLVLVELAMLCLKKAGHPDPLNGGWVRCRETADGYRVALGCYGGRLDVFDYWDGYRRVGVWLASARRAS